MGMKNFANSLKKRGRSLGAAFATAAALTTGFSDAPAFAHDNDGHATYTDHVINDFEDHARDAARRYTFTQSDHGDISALYTNTHLFYLIYDEKEYVSPDMNLFLQATALAEMYGLKNTREYRALKDTIIEYSLYAGSYHHLSPSGRPLTYNANTNFTGAKYEALVDVQNAMANFVERAAPIYNRRGSHKVAEYRAFGRICSATREQGPTLQALYQRVQGQSGLTAYRGAMTAEDRRGRAVVCPPPGLAK